MSDEVGPERIDPAELERRLQMPLVEAMQTQRAVRRLRPDPVDDAVVLRCIELALKAPTGSNGQNWEFVVVKDRTLKAALGRQYRKAWRLYGRVGEWLLSGGDSGPAAVLRKMLGARGADPAEAESTRRIMRAVQWQVDHFEDVPVVVVACLRGGRIPLLPAPPVAVSSFYGSIYPSVQNLLLAARAVGLGASLVTLPLWSTTAVRRILGLPWDVHPCCVVPMGWPKGRYGPTRRRPVGQVVHLDRFGNRPWAGGGR
ncbi:MAG: putative oxidoreductase [Acidimicrobiales bacterium]|nr:MAG: putative oxidoreductase [Acidimicrobiales bacterium]